MAIIDIAAARRGWEALMAEGKGSAVVRQPGGGNQKAIIQPFWLMDPDSPGSMSSNWGVGLVPDLSGTGGLQVNVAVGSLDAGLRGMPTSIQTSAGGEGSWIPRPPFVGSPGGLDTRAHVCPLTGNRGATKLAVLRGVEVSDGVSDTPTKKFLAVAMASGNNIVVVDENDPQHPKELGMWQAPGPIQSRMPVVDAQTGFVAVPVKLPEGYVWYILDLRDRGIPQVIAELKGLGYSGAMSQGVLYTSDGATLTAVDFNRQVEVNAQQRLAKAYLQAVMDPGLNMVQRVGAVAKVRAAMKAMAERVTKDEKRDPCIMVPIKEKLSIALIASDSHEKTKESFWNNISSSSEAIRSIWQRFDVNSKLQVKNDVQRDILIQEHQDFFGAETNIKVIAAHNHIFEWTTMIFKRDIDGAIDSNDNEIYTAIRPGVELLGHKGKVGLPWKDESQNHERMWVDRITNNVSLPVGPRYDGDISCEIHCDVLVLAVCYGKAMYDFWMPKVIPVTPGRTPIIITVASDADKKELEGKILIDLAYNMAVQTMKELDKSSSALQPLLDQFSKRFVEKYNDARVEVTFLGADGKIIRGEKLKPLEAVHVTHQ